jgi:hypothetical protein
MEAGMLSWIFGIALLIILIVMVLDYLELVDFFEAMGAILRLAVALVAAIAAFLLWSARRLAAVARTPKQFEVPQNSGSDDGTVPRGRIETRSMARRATRNIPS